MITSIVGGILQSVLNLIQCVKVLRGVKMAGPCERTLRHHRRNANESLVEKSNRLTREWSGLSGRNLA
jgi:hypothetical protein